MVSPRLIERLTATLVAVCPLDGVALVSEAPLTWRIDYAAQATTNQRDLARAALDSFDPSVTAQQLWEEQQARTDAKAQAQRDGDPAIKLLLALLITTTQSLNTLRQELARLRADVRTAVPTVPTRPPVPTQTLAEARQAVRDAIDTV